MDINELRKEIDALDAELLELFLRRMEISREIGLWKKSEGIPVFDPVREQRKLAEIDGKSGDMGKYSVELWKTLMDLSKDYQNECLKAVE